MVLAVPEVQSSSEVFHIPESQASPEADADDNAKMEELQERLKQVEQRFTGIY
jgi:hypothetical protein